MIPVKTDQTNLILVHPDAGDLPGQFFAAVDPSQIPAGGIQDAPAGAVNTAIETVWQPDPGERARIAAGASIHLTILGPAWDSHQSEMENRARIQHPPVLLQAGPVTHEAPAGATVNVGHMSRVCGWLFAALNENPPAGDEMHAAFDYVTQHYLQGGEWVSGGGRILQFDDWLQLIAEALSATTDAPGEEGERNGGGLHLPSNVRRDR